MLSYLLGSLCTSLRLPITFYQNCFCRNKLVPTFCWLKTIIQSKIYLCSNFLFISFTLLLRYLNNILSFSREHPMKVFNSKYSLWWYYEKLRNLTYYCTFLDPFLFKHITINYTPHNCLTGSFSKYHQLWFTTIIVSHNIQDAL